MTMPYKSPEDRKAYDKRRQEERKAYFREWRSRNPEKVKIYQETYWRRRLQIEPGVSGK
jgi:hypothetical protein